MSWSPSAGRRGSAGSYRQWVEGGIAPHVVFEVLSPGNRPGEMKRKFEFYQRYGVEEYYVYDPFSGSLEGWRRRGGELKKIARMRGFVSPRLGIRFEPGKGQDNLTILGRDGEPFVTPLELSRRNARPGSRGGRAAAREAERQRARPSAERGRASARRRNTRGRIPNANAPRSTRPSSASWESSRIELTSRLVGQAADRRPLEGRAVGAGEGGDDLGEGAEVEVDQAADGVVVEVQVAVGGEGPEAGGALELLEARMQSPPAALVAADGRPPGAEPRVVRAGAG